MAMTWDREDITKFFEGDEDTQFSGVDEGPGWFTDPVDGAHYFRYCVREDEPAGLLLNLRDTGADHDRLAVIRPLLEELNAQRRDDPEAEWGDGWLEVSQPGIEVIGVQNRGDGICPTEYFDELCRTLTARGWTGHLTVPPLVLSHLGGPTGTEPSITTVLGYGVREIPPPAAWSPGQHAYRPAWRGDRELVMQIADTAVAWLEDAPGTTVCGGSLDWTPTADQARAHLADCLLKGPAPSLERLVVGERPEGGRATRTGRAAFVTQGSSMLVEYAPGRPLADRLADHRRLLTSQEHRVQYAYTTGTLGFNYYRPSSVHSRREDLRPHIDLNGSANGVPYQLRGHSPGLPDAYYSQLFPTDWLARAHDLSRWDVDVRERGFVLVTAPDPGPWFEQRIDPRRPDDAEWLVRHVHDAEPDTLRRARADFGDLLQQPMPPDPA